MSHKIAVLLGLCLLLVACQAPKDYHYYMTHPEAIERGSVHCATELPGARSASCQQLIKAARDFSASLNLATYQGPVFGQQVLSLQIKISTLTKQLKTQSQPGLEAQLIQLNNRLAEYYTVVTLLWGSE